MKSVSTFIELDIAKSIAERLESRGITAPTKVQSEIIPRVLTGESLVVKSQTGSGKSLAYIVPLLQMTSVRRDETDVRRDGANGAHSTAETDATAAAEVLVLLPTRELAEQVAREFRACGEEAVVAIYGGVDYEAHRALLRLNPTVVVATVGRLLDLMEQGLLGLDGVRYLVLDEADQMVDMGFRDDVTRLARLSVNAHQRLCFSATLSAEVRAMLGDVVGEYSLVEDLSQRLAAQSIRQVAYFVESALRDQLLLHLIRSLKPSRAIIFCRSRGMADRVVELVREAQMSAEVIHSERSQAAREHIIGRFTSGETTLLVATDLIARGVHVDGVTHIFNLGLPLNPELYIHRIGRTGRAGESGVAISILQPDERELLNETTTLMRQPIEVVTTHPYMTPAVTQALANRGVNRGAKGELKGGKGAAKGELKGGKGAAKGELKGGKEVRGRAKKSRR
ncbi:MAG: DEAD/DEAH box helicase [Rikenellaceae bacterium]